jgi:peptidyl-prolyl cis-trans isomerase D
MIKLIREGAQKYPWILKFIVLGIAITFTIGMGWFGFDQAQQPNAVAVIGPYQVTLKEFRRAYNRTYQFYRNQLKQEEVDEASLKQLVIGGLVDSKAWALTADHFQLDIGTEELKGAIRNRKEFQKDGVFDAQLYHRLLADNKFSPQQFESQLSTDLLSEKAQMIVQDATTLTPSELKEVEELASRQSAGKEDEHERIRLQFLFQKKQRALQAFQAAMRASTDVEIREEYL